jgi:hypothetical protein
VEKSFLAREMMKDELLARTRAPRDVRERSPVESALHELTRSGVENFRLRSLGIPQLRHLAHDEKRQLT